MADLQLIDNVFKLTGSGHVVIQRHQLTPAFMAALLAEPDTSPFFLPDLFDILEAETANDLRDALKRDADPATFKAYQSLLDRFSGLQLGHGWDLAKLEVVWRYKVEAGMIEEVFRVRSGNAYVILAGTKEVLSEFDLHRRTLKNIGEHLDSAARDAATIAKYTKLILAAPIVERRICASTPGGVATISVFGPSCLEPSQWVLPADITFINTES